MSTRGHVISSVTILVSSEDVHMLFAGWEVRMVKTFDRGLENAARARTFPRILINYHKSKSWC